MAQRNRTERAAVKNARGGGWRDGTGGGQAADSTVHMRAPPTKARPFLFKKSRFVSNSGLTWVPGSWKVLQVQNTNRAQIHSTRFKSVRSLFQKRERKTIILFIEERRKKTWASRILNGLGLVIRTGLQQPMMTGGRKCVSVCFSGLFRRAVMPARVRVVGLAAAVGRGSDGRAGAGPLCRFRGRCRAPNRQCGPTGGATRARSALPRFP